MCLRCYHKLATNKSNAEMETIMNNNILSQKFTTYTLLKFTLPIIIMMIFMSLYTSVDGAFVSRFVSEDALSAINIVFPIVSVIMAIGLMFATGSNAIIATRLGMGHENSARQFFTFIYIISFVIGIIITIVGLMFGDKILVLLGATPTLHTYAIDYLEVLILFAPLTLLQMLSQAFFVTEGKSNLGLVLTIIGGIANIVFDYLFIAIFHMGIQGAAWATGIGYAIPALFGVWYFFFHKKGNLYFVKPKLMLKDVLNSCFNGSSELVNNLSIAITTLLFNLAMLKYVGDNGIAAITIILYIQFIQAAIYYGYAQGVAPIISYKYGEGNREQLKNIIKISMRFTFMASILVIVLSVLFVDQAVGIFVKSSSEVFGLAKEGFLIFSISYLFMGFNIFISAMFTAFGNGTISALLSLMRTFVLLIGILALLPTIMGVTGIWLAVPIAEGLAVIISIYFFVKYRTKYHY